MEVSVPEADSAFASGGKSRSSGALRVSLEQSSFYEVSDGRRLLFTQVDARRK